jgi:hypothetical protein
MLSSQLDQADRKEVLENDRRLRQQQEQGSTFLEHTHNEAGGRYAAISSPQIVGSTTPIPKYEGAPNWAHDPSGIEPSLGYRIDNSELTPSAEPPAAPTPDPGHEEHTSVSDVATPLAAKRLGLGLSSRTYRRA